MPTINSHLDFHVRAKGVRTMQIIKADIHQEMTDNESLFVTTRRASENRTDFSEISAQKANFLLGLSSEALNFHEMWLDMAWLTEC